MAYRMLYATLALSLLLQASYAQDTIPELTSKDSIVNSYWLAGLGINIVDDSWRARGNYSLGEMWNFVPYPSRLSFGRYFKSGIGLEVIGTYNKFKDGKIIDGVPISEESDYWAVDTRVSYDLNRLFGETGIFDPYLGAGLGYTETDVRRRTANGVVGFRLWFSDKWGADINTTGKWGLDSESTNHIQHAAGVVYRFGMEKELSRKGQEKLAVIEAMLAEQQRVEDSIQVALEAEERARQLALEQEQRRKEALAAAEAKRLEEEAARQQALREKLNSFGKVTFGFDSSYLTKSGKETLRKVAEFLRDNDELSVALGGHADSQGPSQYNQWLSERRAKRAFDFLTTLGISSERIEYQGYGENELLNHCENGVPCSDQEHSVNRRLAILITVF